MSDLCALRVNEARFREDFDALARIGATADGGVHRPAFSAEHLQARSWFLERAREAGLETEVDGAGNHSAVYRCGSSPAQRVLLGSHLDSVPQGGRFDGALGVLGALETLRVAREKELSLAYELEAIDFTDEEGRYLGLLGSRALSGVLTAEALDRPRGDSDAFAQALKAANLNKETVLSAKREATQLAAYLEIHIEQGVRLSERRAHVGIATGIVGIRGFRVAFRGRADHAGTAEMNMRLDAAQGAAAFTLSARTLVMRTFPECVVNVGDIRVEPGAFNIVPEVATVALEFRSADGETLDAMEAGLLQQAERDADAFGLRVATEPVDRIEPILMDARMIETLENVCRALGLHSLRMPSRAAHDAQSLARVCPAGLVFVPSEGGRSHSPEEFTEWDDCVRGANVLLQTALRLARAGTRK